MTLILISGHLHVTVLATNSGEKCGLVPIRKLHWEQRSSRFGNERFFCKVKENKDFRGDVLEYVAQGNPQFDAEIAKKRRFRTGTG
jgi:hypothetical protein